MVIESPSRQILERGGELRGRVRADREFEQGRRRAVDDGIAGRPIHRYQGDREVVRQTGESLDVRAAGDGRHHATDEPAGRDGAAELTETARHG